MRWKRGHRPKLIGESEASGATREIFRQVRDALGVPVVPKLYQAYAACPEFLQAHWEVFRPAVQSRQFFVLGTRLAAESYTRAHNYFDVPPLRRREPPAQEFTVLSISQVLDYYQYLDPLLLLISAAQMQAFEEPVGLGSPAAAEIADHPQFAAEPFLLRDEQASPALNRSWEERRRVLELAFISDEHRALACWPEFYLDYWAALKQLLQSPVYADCQYRLAESALDMLRELPVRVEISVSQLLAIGVPAQQITAVARINEAFIQALTGLQLDITFARIGWERGAPESVPHKEPAMEPIATHAGSHPMRAA